MILDALSRLRSSHGRQKSGEGRDRTSNNMASTYSDDMEDPSRNSVAPSVVGGLSIRSTTTTSSGLYGSPSIASLSSTKGSQMSRRMSNNLFGSGKFHDYQYMNSVRQRKMTASSVASRSSSVKHADSAASMGTVTSSRVGKNDSMYSESLRPVTPEGSSAYTNSVPSSPNKPVYAKDENSDHIADLGAGMMIPLSPAMLGKASMALDEVIRELEEEGDDEIVMERSPAAVPHANHIPSLPPMVRFGCLVHEGSALKLCTSLSG